ncbi:NAD(P)/FAD-dependent oxidoreductase [Ilumatobacter sp.]|uniref:flavin-containing monooxygenase n=2 Tax=Ilumatobacter sp. TaxID=1967498 RepID=UPI003297DC1F
MGFEPNDVDWPDGDASENQHDVIIVGAGVSGVCLAAKLRRLGIGYRVFEKNAEVGGTWFENRYPGCGVDTPNHFYSYSFAPNSEWKHFFSPRDELQTYVEDCATAFGIRDRIEFDTAVTSASWDPDSSRWNVTVRGPDGIERVETAAVFVSASGHFNQPTVAEFPGQSEFAGEIFHTARWPDNANLAGKRVGIIGTGASSMQVVPTIASEVDSLTIFQRTPQWARPIPEYNLPVVTESQWLFDNVPYYDRWYRFAQFWRYGDGLLRFLKKDPSWEHPDRSLNRINERHRVEMADYIAEKLSDRPDLIDKCTPTYPPFGKRILIDNGWFDTLCEPHVELVTDGIDHFTPTGCVTADGVAHELDVMIMATGFTVTNLAARLNVTGRNGRRLADDWAHENPTAHLGITVPEFPNFFVMYGPNTNMGHGGSGIWLAETQTHYITKCIVNMADEGVETVEVRPEVRRAYTERIDEMHEQLIWTHEGTRTYYRNQFGKVRSPMPFRLVDYWLMTREPDFDDFIVTAIESKAAAEPDVVAS